MYSEYDTDDAELGLQGKRGLDQGGVMLDNESEANFGKYLNSEEGKKAFEQEQRRIERRLEMRYNAQQAKKKSQA